MVPLKNRPGLSKWNGTRVPRDIAMLDIKQYGSGSPGPKLLITGGVHGDEYEPIAAILRLTERLQETDIRGSVTLIPVVNNPSYRLGRRAAEDDLDLARTCPGSPTGSVTEQIAAALSIEIENSDYFIDLHSGGKILDIWPMAGYMLHPEADVLDKQRQMAKAFNLPLVWGTDYRLDGRSLSVARDAKVPAIYCEYGGVGRCEGKCVAAYVEGCLNVMGSLDMIDRTPPAPAVEWVVEDSRPQSGYLQRNHPSPSAGIFETQAAIGQQIERGQPLGCVIDVATGTQTEVKAEHNGLLLALRALAKVERGDCLGVVVEVDHA